MTTLTPENEVATVNVSKESAEGWTPARLVRDLAASPAVLYNWLSGPPTTELMRSRAALAEVSNEQGRKILFI